MTHADSGRISILLGIFVVALLGVGFYVVRSFEEQVDPRDRHRTKRSKRVVEEEPFAPLPYDRRGRVPVVCVDTVAREGSKPPLPLVRLTGALVGFVKTNWTHDDLRYRRHRLDRERLESLIVALLGAAERSRGELRVRLMAPERNPIDFRITETALRTLLARGLEGDSGRDAELLAVDLVSHVLRDAPAPAPAPKAWPLRGVKLAAMKGPQRLENRRDLEGALRRLPAKGFFREGEHVYRVHARPHLTRWDRENSAR